MDSEKMGREKMGWEKMARLMRMTVTIILLAAVAVQPASARRRKSEESWDNLKKLRVGEEIQVVYQEEQYLNGRFLGFTPDGISVQWGRVNPHDETIAREDVIRVIASRPSARAKNTLLGLGGGALAGLGMLSEADTTEGSALIVVPVIAVIGALGGALSSPDATIYQARPEAVRPELKRRRPAEPSEFQEPNPEWDKLRELRIFQEVRVLDHERRIYNARFYSVSDEGISFSGPDGEVSIPRHEVLEVSIERPREENFTGWTDLTAEERVTLYSNYPRPEIGFEDRRDSVPCVGGFIWDSIPTWDPALLSGSPFPPARETCGSELPWGALTSY